MPNNKWFTQYQRMTPAEKITPAADSNSGVYTISTEFFRANGDNIELYMFPTTDGLIRMEEGGFTTDLISTSGVDVHAPKTAQKITKIARNEAVKVDRGILYVTVTDNLDAVIQGKQQLLRAIIALSNRFGV